MVQANCLTQRGRYGTLAPSSAADVPSSTKSNKAMAEPRDDYPAAAQRCLADGELLLQEGRLANATHLFGLAAECALKVLLESHSGVSEVRLAHLPKLRDHALKTLHRRQDGGIQQLLNKADYMDGWAIDNRYWPDAVFSEERCRLHRDHCRRTLIAANLGT